MSAAVEILAVPFGACLILAGIHTYLGLHVVERGVIFVDLALAQVAALGVTFAFLAGHPLQGTAAYLYSLAFTIFGAALFSLTRTREGRIPQEAIIGVVYAVSAAAAVLAVDRAPQGAEHIKQILVGSILTISREETIRLLVLYAGIGAFHWAFRRRFLLISMHPMAAEAQGLWTRLWDFLFYTSFGFVVTSSVRVAGVLLVFSYLIVPALCAILLARGIGARLLAGWALGIIGSAAGLLSSYRWDLPTGATVVCTFGALLAITAAGRALLFTATRMARGEGTRILVGAGVVGSGLLAAAGVLLAAFPQGPHVWLDLVEAGAPRVHLAFLTPREREAYWDSRGSIEGARAEIEGLRRMKTEAEWGERELPPERLERVRQFLVSRTEIAWGDRMVLRTLRAKARERQRFIIGLPMTAIGLGLLAVSLRWRRRSRAGRAGLCIAGRGLGRGETG